MNLSALTKSAVTSTNSTENVASVRSAGMKMRSGIKAGPYVGGSYRGGVYVAFNP